MFGTKLAIYGIAALAVVTIIGLGYAHYQGLVEDNARLRENEVKLMTALESQKSATKVAQDAIAQWKESSEELGRRLQEMAEVQQQATAQTRKLNDLFAKHDLELLSARKPGLMRRRINSGSAALRRMLECATGGGSDCPDQGGPAPGPATP